MTRTPTSHSFNLPAVAPRRSSLVLAALLTASSASAAVTDIGGSLTEVMNTVVGAGNSGRLISTTTTHWQATTSSVDIDLNNNEFRIDTGGGNAQIYNGAITGSGTLRLTGRSDATWTPDIQLGGAADNSPGNVLITQGRVTLNKTAGIDALAGPITVNTGATARIQLTQDHQIDDASTLTSTSSSGAFHLELGGHDETLAALDIKTGHWVETGSGGVLNVATLTVGGVAMPRGAYTAGSGFVTGTGYIDVDNFGPPVVSNPPGSPATPSPADANTQVHPATFTKLTWSAATDAAGYDVYLWPASSSKPAVPNAADLALNEYPLATPLLSLTAYKWQVIAKNAAGETPGAEWNFATVDRRDIAGALGQTLDSLVGSGPARLTADAITHWQATTSTSDILLNGHRLTINTGGGNGQTYDGTITGPGTLRFQGRNDATFSPDMRLGGSGSNSPDGVLLQYGRVQLNKTSGMDALAGPVTIDSVDTVRLQWLGSHQVNDASVIDSTATSGQFHLELGGFNESIAGLSIRSGHSIDTGNGGVLTTTTLAIDGTGMGAGTYTSASHGFISGTGSLVVGSGGGSSFETWAGGKGLSGQTAAFHLDPDADGIPTGLEFVLGGEPNPASPSASSSNLLPTASRDGDDFVFTFQRRHESAYLAPVVEFSPRLDSNWTTAVDPANSTIGVTPGSQSDLVTVTIPSDEHPTLFVRLKAVDTAVPGQPAPRITASPENADIPEGENFTLTAGAGGAKQVSWQWYFNGNAIEGATGSTHTVSAATPAAQGEYHVVVTNESGNAISAKASIAVTAAPGANGLDLIPWPLQVQPGSGDLAIAPGARIVASDPSLLDAATVLATEITATHAVTLPVVSSAPAEGDIVLELDASLAGERHTLAVTDRAIVRGRNAFSVSLGTSTLLQSLRTGSGALLCPRVTIDDQPAVGIRALHLDLARADHSLESLLQAVDLCRLYKINYLHLHFNDDQAYTFPSAAFPLLNTVTVSRGRKVYTLAEMEQLEAYAVARGVYIMPELEMPGHCNLMLVAYPELFKITYPTGPSAPYEPSSSINVAKAEVRAAVRTLIGEHCAVFQSTPYIHLGCDEVDWAWSENNADFQAVFTEWGFNRPNPRDNVHLVFAKFITIARDYAAEFGKQSIVWENGAMTGSPEVPAATDILVMPFDSYNPGSFPANGIKLVNAAWSPLYVVDHLRKPVSSIYDWDRTIFGQYSGECDDYASQTVAAEHVLGTQLTTFEQEEDMEMMSVRRRLAAMSERTWNPSLGTSFANFSSRLDHTDALLDSLLSPVRITYGGLDNPDDRVFGTSATASMSLTPGAAGQPLVIRYTTNRSDVTSSSPLYTGPITLTGNGYFRAAAFNTSGQRVGRMARELHRREMTVVDNLAAGKPVTANSGSNAARAVDLRDCQGWNTEVSTARPAGETLTVDLGALESISRIALLFAPSGSYSYRLEISPDGSTWTTVAEATIPGTRAGVTHNFTSTPARHVRVTLRPLAGSTGEKSLREIMVSGD